MNDVKMLRTTNYIYRKKEASKSHQLCP